MGSGHYIPEGMSKADYAKLKRKWEKKLAKSMAKDGLVDIEQSDDEGFVSGMFLADHGNTDRRAAYDQMRRYTPEKAEFYRQCSIFLMCFLWPSITFEKYPQLGDVMWDRCRHIWSLYNDGLSTLEVYKRLPQDWKIGRYKCRYLIEELRVMSATFNRTDPKGGNYDSDF